MVRTFGLTHMNLAVEDATPGSHNGIVFNQTASHPGQPGGVAHFGFRLISPSDMDPAVAEVERVGEKIMRRGEFSPGYPYAYVGGPRRVRDRDLV